MSNRIKESNITPGAVTSDKIAPGTISASNITPGTITGTQIATDTIASSNIAPGTIANDRLANTGITINGTTIALGASGDIVAGTDWQSVVVADGSTGTTASAGEGYFIDTTSAAHTITLPADGSSTIGDTIIIRDYAGTFATNNVTLTSTAKISGADSDGTLSTNDLVVTLVYVDSTKGWVTIENEAKAVGAVDASYISATGGTVLTTGDYKTHVFTGDGCFVVSCGGNPSGSDTVEYLVVAGGGGAGGAGTAGGATQAGGAGGAGGFRTYTTLACASPLNACSALTVSVSTYPVTVGGGGAADPSNSAGGSPGSNSVFSTITSTGGGGGGAKNLAGGGKPGGSGGSGAGSSPCASPNNFLAGSGNTPPTSPSQGNNGGASAAHPANNSGSGGGGGAGAVGTTAPTDDGAPGGNGSYVPDSFFGPTAPSYGQSPAPLAPNGRYFAGGGGGASSNTPGSSGVGGAGGGGTGANNAGPVSPTGGGTNTGGGAGAPGGPAGGLTPKTAGGKGIVVIRYKFQ